MAINLRDLNPIFAGRLSAIIAAGEKATGEKASFLSGRRTAAQGVDIWNRATGGGRHAPSFPAARPGRSLHEQGLAVDMAPGKLRDWVRAHMKEYGLAPANAKRGVNWDPNHIQLDRGVLKTAYDATPNAFAAGVPAQTLPPAQQAAAALAAGQPPGGPPTLRKGATDARTGGAVTQLQRQLAAVPGGPPVAVDGKYGPQTAAAVRAVEKKYGLTQDRGVAGPQVQAALAGNERLRTVTDTRQRFGDPLATGGFPSIPGSPPPMGIGRNSPVVSPVPVAQNPALIMPRPQGPLVTAAPDPNAPPLVPPPQAVAAPHSLGPYITGAPGRTGIPVRDVTGGPLQLSMPEGDAPVGWDAPKPSGSWTHPPMQDITASGIPGGPMAPRMPSSDYTTGVPGRTGNAPAGINNLGDIVDAWRRFRSDVMGGPPTSSASPAVNYPAPPPSAVVPPAVSAVSAHPSWHGTKFSQNMEDARPRDAAGDLLSPAALVPDALRSKYPTGLPGGVYPDYRPDGTPTGMVVVPNSSSRGLPGDEPPASLPFSGVTAGARIGVPQQQSSLGGYPQIAGSGSTDVLQGGGALEDYLQAPVVGPPAPATVVPAGTLGGPGPVPAGNPVLDPAFASGGLYGLGSAGDMGAGVDTTATGGVPTNDFERGNPYFAGGRGPMAAAPVGTQYIGATAHPRPSLGARIAKGAVTFGASALGGPAFGMLASVIGNSLLRSGSLDNAQPYRGPIQGRNYATLMTSGGVPALTQWGTRQYSGPSGVSDSPFTPSGYTAPSFDPISGGPSYAYNPQTQTYVDSQGRVHSYAD